MSQTRTPNSTDFSTPYRFNAKELDPESGLFYYGARYYHPVVSKWLSVDPLAEKGPQYSPYNYCFNNPVHFTDPDGRWPGPPFGFRLGFNLGLGSNGVNFNVTASAGVEHRTPNFQAVALASASVYGGQQLGTSSMTRGLQFDVTAGAYASVGTGTGSAHNFYTLNFNTASPFNNTFNTSFTYGQVRTFNSAINASGDGPGWQTQGIVGARFGENFSFSSNNDAKFYGTGFTNRLLGDNNTDAGWTGGIVLNIGGVEAGYQNFSGYWSEFGSEGTGYGHIFSAENRLGGNGAYHQSLNRAFNFVRSGNFTVGVFSGAWLQNWIHKNISDDGTYNYNNQGNINTTIGQ
ncbi:RHS repeat-associated core domain-containing protein [Schleiferia thermophila]|uniref:RHS repeat-associated core domain-containing protein n=1 Tax=Schleiferia thermophila TaxID=884107 RepID=UPI002FD9D87A